jgi:hypothetical protein
MPPRPRSAPPADGARVGLTTVAFGDVEVFGLAATGAFAGAFSAAPGTGMVMPWSFMQEVNATNAVPPALKPLPPNPPLGNKLAQAATAFCVFAFGVALAVGAAPGRPRVGSVTPCLVKQSRYALNATPPRLASL